MQSTYHDLTAEFVAQGTVPQPPRRDAPEPLKGRLFGKLPAKPQHPHLVGLTADALRKLALPPDHTSWTRPGDAWPMFCNDTLSCCTASAQALGALHMTRIAQSAIIWPDDAVLALYSATSGYDPANPASDHGAYVADVAAYMVRNGETIGAQAPEVLSAALPLDPRNIDTLCRAIATFGWINCGWTLTQAMARSTNGCWDYVPDSPDEGGHDAIIVDYRTVMEGRVFKVATWSQEFWVSEQCVQHAMDEAWLCISREHWTTVNGITPLGTVFDDAIAFAASLTT